MLFPAKKRRKLARTPDSVSHRVTISAQQVTLSRPMRGAERMKSVLDLPLAVFALSMVAMWLSTQIGVSFRKRVFPLKEGEKQDFNLVIPATLTLLGLI